ncbi:hypothetical protein [Gabonibacter chumensis]|uniref:hypothetical protein n=1 Tax=Gabonibacter chumensis TaxID=2972474 RepID=UPI002573AB67|nr:hypothetical protein [Gabonibacter chumensis]MCR9012142.1 hypothetical protein [Gabonibacter chumensis]
MERGKMKYIPSINIEQNGFDAQRYIVTPNALSVVGNIVDAFNAGVHSFNIIGSYGTGKSNFILALEDSLKGSNIIVSNRGQFNGYSRFNFVKIVGDYTSLSNLLTTHMFAKNSSGNLFKDLDKFFARAESKDEFVFIVIDEFGKLLEYAAKNNPEKELYLFQQFTEFMNSEKRNAVLLTTLHQNFNSYAHSLTVVQRQEWNKVKGRFKEIVFNEPVEQLLYVASKRIEKSPRKHLNKGFEEIYKLAQKTKFASDTIEYNTALSLYPLDLFAAQALTLSIQRYGQNERTLFSFLESTGDNSLHAFKEGEYRTYSLADVYDYALYNFHSYLSEVNADSSSWAGIRVGLERIEGLFESGFVTDATKLVKTIGMMNLFGNAGVSCTKEELSLYAKYALNIEEPEAVINLLTKHKIIRYANYKSQYVLFEGTDVNIEGELLSAAGIVPRSKDIIDKLSSNFNLPREFANASYFRTGTPRYFEYIISDTSINRQPQNEIDGFINLIFNEDLSVEKLCAETKDVEEAILYAYFKNTEDIVNHIWDIDKLIYVQNYVDSTDNVAQREIKALLHHERNLLNSSVLNTLYDYTDNVVWVWKGEVQNISSKTAFNKFLSEICNEVYAFTPTFKNEMVNKHKPSGAMSLARVNYLMSLLENANEKDLKFDDTKFPPEKTIYLTLLQNTGIHRRYLGAYELMAPEDETFMPLWNACEAFMDSCKEKPRKLSELIAILKTRPFKLKQGVIDLWLPTYLIIKRNDYSLYNDKGVYIPKINRDVLDILQKAPGGFQVKAFNVEGIKLDLFNRYREALSMSQDDEFTTDNLLETIKPFIVFYKKLNPYTKHTRRLPKTTLQFRYVLSNAKDPEKTFFDDLPHALGFKDTGLVNNADILKSYVDLLQKAIRDLRGCYAALIKRIESALVEALQLNSPEFSKYKVELENRYSCVKTYLLTDRQKVVLNRVLAPSTDRVTWIQSLAYVILDKQLENLLDEEEEYLIENLIHVFKELDKFIDLSKRDLDNCENFIRVEMISKDGAMSPQVIHLTDSKVTEAKRLEEQITKMLSGNNDIDAYALLNIIKKRIGND